MYNIIIHNISMGAIKIYNYDKKTEKSIYNWFDKMKSTR